MIYFQFEILCLVVIIIVVVNVVDLRRLDLPSLY